VFPWFLEFIGDFAKTPTPMSVFLVTVEYTRSLEIFEHMAWSYSRFFIAYILAAVIGIPLGIGMGYSGVLRTIFMPMVNMIRPIPPVAKIPISILWFGLGEFQKWFIIFFGAFFPILMDTMAGVMTVERRHLHLADMLEADEWIKFKKVVLPAALPAIVTGLRVGMAIGFECLVAAELVAHRGVGLGFLIERGRYVLAYNQIVMGMLAIGVLVFLMDAVFRRAEMKVLRWRYV
jgi:ABC-type nitrate/sulfonate/bicarbonate transport system permease component